MARVTIHLAQTTPLAFYANRNVTEVAQRLLALGMYAPCPAFEVDGEGEKAAEEVFDLTNNPGRQDERELAYGRGRSVSVGDIVEVDGVRFLCASSGWVELNTVAQ